MYSNDLATAGIFATLFGSMIGVLLVLLLVAPIIAVSLIANWKLFKKAGKKGWEAIVPFYNSWVLVEISGLEWWWFLLMIATSILGTVSEDLSGLASLVSLFASFNCWYNIAKKFKKDTTTSVLAGIFSFIFLIVFAFSKKDQYYAEEKVSKFGILGKFFDKESNNDSQTKTAAETNPQTNVNNNSKYCVYCGAKLDGDYKFCPKCGKEM